MKNQCIQDGFNNVPEIRTVQTFSVKSQELHQEHAEIYKKSILEELAASLGRKILSANLTEVNYEKNEVRGTQTFILSISAVQPGIKYVNVLDNVLSVNGEKFSEGDLIRAVKIAYPERFI